MALNKRCAPLIFNTFVKPFFRLIRFDNLLFLIILIGVMEKWVVAPIMNHFLLPEPLLWWHLLLLIVAVVCIAAGGYVINDYFDVKIDRINHPDELVVTRDVTKEQAMHLFYGFTAVGIASGVALSIVLKSTALFTVFVLIPGLLWFYSASYKRQFLLGNLIVSVLAALVPITVGLAGDAAVKLAYGEDAFGTMLYANVYIYLLFFSAFAFLCTWIREVIKDIEDQEGDRELECHTWAVKFGTRSAQVFATILIIIAMGALSWVEFSLLPPFSWSSLACRFYLFLMVGFVSELALLWSAQLPQDFKHAQQLMKLIMFIGMLFSFCVSSLIQEGLY